MVEELKTVLEGKAITIKGKNYLATAAYVKPFVERLEPFGVEFRCQVKTPDLMTVDRGVIDMTFVRVNISAVFPKVEGQNYKRVLTMAYGLDLKTPVVKFYIGALDNEDNFIVFDPNAISIQEIEPETPINYNAIKHLLERTDNISVMLNSIQNVEFDRDFIYKYLGEWIDFTIDSCFINQCGKIKLASSMPIDVYKMVMKDKDSSYYISTEDKITVYDIYSAFLSLIRDDDKDIINRFEKTILVDNLLKL